MSTREPTEDSFLKDVAAHEMSALLDNGIYRHLRLKQPTSSNMWFDIVTWPGFLAYAGDMGAFTFTRLEDMFQFFRTSSAKGELRINPSYWGEKLEAVDSHCHNPGHGQFSEERLRERIEEYVKQWVDDFEADCESSETESQKQKKSFEKELRLAVNEDVLRCMDDGEHEARKAVFDFSYEIGGHKFQFQDSWEWGCQEYTYRFVWCCYAITWAIRKYDDALFSKKEDSCKQEQ